MPTTRRILVTGAGGDLGQHFVASARARGWVVFQHHRRPSPHADIVGDLVLEQVTQALIEFVEKESVDTVVLNAASTRPGVLGELSDQAIEDVVTTNLLAPARLLAGFARSSTTRRITVVAISSVAALAPIPGNALYGVTKRAFDDLLQRVAVESPHLTYVVVRPGPFASRRNALDDYYASRPSLVVHTSDVAAAVVDVVENRRARVLTVGWRYKLLITIERVLPPMLWERITNLFGRSRLDV